MKNTQGDLCCRIVQLVDIYTRSPTQGLHVVAIHTWELDLIAILTLRCFLEAYGPSTPSDNLQCLLSYKENPLDGMGRRALLHWILWLKDHVSALLSL